MHHRPTAPPRPYRAGVPVLRTGRSRQDRFLVGRLSRVLVVTAAVTAALLVTPVLGGPAELPTTGLDASSQWESAGPPDSSTSAFPGTSRAPAPVADPSPVGDPTPVADPSPVGDPTPVADPSPVGDPSPPPSGAPSPAPAEDSTARPSTTGAATTDDTASPSAPGPPHPAPSPALTAPAATSHAPGPVVAAPAARPHDEAQVLVLVNHERRRAGCGPLTAAPPLAAVARAHSADMRDRGFFDHVNLDGLDPFDRAHDAGIVARAENIARGQADAAAVMTSWMNSPGHRANILDCELTLLGVGVAEGPGGPWWTQLFG